MHEGKGSDGDSFITEIYFHPSIKRCVHFVVEQVELKVALFTVISKKSVFFGFENAHSFSFLVTFLKETWDWALTGIKRRRGRLPKKEPIIIVLFNLF